MAPSTRVEASLRRGEVDARASLRAHAPGPSGGDTPIRAAVVVNARGAATPRVALMRIAGLDHLVLTVADPDATVAFYERLGMRREVFGDGRLALHFGSQKINPARPGRQPGRARAAAPAVEPMRSGTTNVASCSHAQHQATLVPPARGRGR